MKISFTPCRVGAHVGSGGFRSQSIVVLTLVNERGRSQDGITAVERIDVAQVVRSPSGMDGVADTVSILDASLLKRPPVHSASVTTAVARMSREEDPTMISNSPDSTIHSP